MLTLKEQSESELPRARLVVCEECRNMTRRIDYCREPCNFGCCVKQKSTVKQERKNSVMEKVIIFDSERRTMRRA